MASVNSDNEGVEPDPASPSQYALDYGLAKEEWLTFDGKSGLTPLKLVEELYIRPNLETWKLLTAGAIGLGDGHPQSDLRGIHPMFSREKWDTELPPDLAFYPLGHGQEGYYRADNNFVWAVLRPCLALATRFIANAHCWPWYDALLWAERRPLTTPVPQGQPSGDYFTFHQRSPHVLDNNGGAQPAFMALGNRIRWGISSGFTKVTTGRPLGHTCSMTVLGNEAGNRFGLGSEHVKITVPYELLAHMIFGRLDPAERLVSQFHLAMSCIHEISHALNGMLYPDLPEPFYESETIAELGCSGMNAIMGGEFLPVLYKRNEWWHLRERGNLALLFKKGFPTVQHAQPHLVCLDPKLLAGIGERESFPAPIQYIADMQQEAFWDTYIDTYGSEATRPWPLTLGMSYISDGWRPGEAKFEEATPFTRDWTRETAPLGIGPYADESRAFRNWRISKAIRVCEKLGYDIEAEQDEPSLRPARYSRRRWERARVAMSTWKHPILDQRKEDRKFKANMVQPPEYGVIRDLLIQFYDDLALSTMVNWLPTNLVLDYVNRSRAQPDKVTKEGWYLFLEYCQSSGKLFRFSKEGAGMMRRVDSAWPMAVLIPKEMAAIESTPQILEIRNLLIRESKSIFLHDGLRDYSQELLYQRFTHALKKFTVDDPVTRLPVPRYNISHFEFHGAVLYNTYINSLVIFGPPRIYRVIDQGWPGHFGPGPDVPISDSDESSEDSDFSSDDEDRWDTPVDLDSDSDESDSDMTDSNGSSVYPHSPIPED